MSNHSSRSNDEFAGIDIIVNVLANNIKSIIPECKRQEARKLKRRRTMKAISAIALLAGLAASVPAFAQSPDPAANAVAGGASGATTGAIIGCIVTIPVGCAPGAAVGAAVGGGVGVTAGAASTPTYAPPPPPPPYYRY
jgi:hypothetical protein